MELRRFTAQLDSNGLRSRNDGKLDVGGFQRKNGGNSDGFERRYSILIASTSEAFTRSLIAIMPRTLYSPIIDVSNASDAKRKILERKFDVVVVNTPLSDEFGMEFAFDVCSESGICALLFARSEHFSEVSAKATPRGVPTLVKPSSGQSIIQTLGLLCGFRERLRKMEQKNESVEEKMREIRVVNHAKLLLIEQLKMTEQEAHRYIEKQAMDRCVTRREIAETIIATRRG